MNSERLLDVLNSASIRCLVVLAHFVWQGSAVAMVTAAGLFWTRRATAAMRYSLAVSGLALMAVCPLGTILIVRAAPPVSPVSLAALSSDQMPARDALEHRVPLPAAEDLPAADPSTTTKVLAAASQVAPEPVADKSGPWQLAPIIVGIYGLGVLLLLARLTLGLHGGRRLCRQAMPVRDASLLAALDRQVQALGLRAAPVLAICPRVVVPTVVGILRPTILLPLAIIAGLAPHELEAILAHELAHLRRYDHLVNLLQRLIEACLFFHPAVWWVSRRIRIEREYCCDDQVVALGAEPSAYAASLLHVAELIHAAAGPRPTVEGLCAVRAPSSLRQRIARLLGASDEPVVRLSRVWPLPAALAVCALLAIPALLPSESPQPPLRAEAQVFASDWGEPSGGLRMRITPVSVKTDEQKPDLANVPEAPRFADSREVTFVVELQNISDKPISLQGTRYGDGVSPPWPGKRASRTFGPQLFALELLDKHGKPLDQPLRTRRKTDMMLDLRSGLAETVAPGKSLLCLVHPIQWDASTARLLTAGEYQVRLRYHGPAPAAKQEVKRRWPDNAVAAAWTGDVSSTPVAFTIVDSPEDRLPDPVWGPVNQGLQTAARYRNSAAAPQALRDNASATFPHGTRLEVELDVKNVSDKTISFWSETWRQDDEVVLIDVAGKENPLRGHAWYSGWVVYERWTLKPGQVAVMPAIAIGIADVGQTYKTFDHPIGSIVAVKPGSYKLRYELQLDKGGDHDKYGTLIPDKDIWQGKLTTGNTPITVRARKAEDDPPTFTARLRFQSADGKPVESGHVVVRQSGRQLLAKGEFKANAFEVPRCPFDTLELDVRAPGFEETRFYDVVVEPDKVTSLSLKRADPVRLRLATPAGQPVAGAKVRHFNRSAVEAGSGPYPTDGLKGEVWATSNADGEIVLDSLQKIDPWSPKLGNNIYWFYVEPPAHAPFFIGPVQAGQDLGKMVVSPYLEVRGEVRGTPAELAAFAAEWDQPAEMKRGNGEASWSYAESKPLQTKLDGDKLTFQLSGLRPGTLRIVSRFKQGGTPISHEYARRTPTEDDVVFELQLIESRSDLVVTNTGPKKK